MGFSLKDWLIKKMFKDTTKYVNMADIMSDQDVQNAAYEIYLRELAFWTCVNKIANAVSKCEFKTFYRGKEVKEKEYYLWNVEPNQNQNATAFLNKLIGKVVQRKRSACG